MLRLRPSAFRNRLSFFGGGRPATKPFVEQVPTLLYFPQSIFPSTLSAWLFVLFCSSGPSQTLHMRFGNRAVSFNFCGEHRPNYRQTNPKLAVTQLEWKQPVRRSRCRSQQLEENHSQCPSSPGKRSPDHFLTDSTDFLGKVSSADCKPSETSKNDLSIWKRRHHLLESRYFIVTCKLQSHSPSHMQRFMYVA